MIDYNVVVMDMKVKEAVTINEDGSYTIFVNDSLCPDGKRDATLHALKHIARNDFEKDNIQEIEERARRL